jgi:post-segregation antitoxin (ccd killing protein)
MTRKIAISVPDDVAERLDREPNVSAFITETVRRRMVSDRVRESLVRAGLSVSDEGVARAAAELDNLHAGITAELRRQAAEVRAQISRGRPE